MSEQLEDNSLSQLKWATFLAILAAQCVAVMPVTQLLFSLHQPICEMELMWVIIHF